MFFPVLYCITLSWYSYTRSVIVLHLSPSLPWEPVCRTRSQGPLLPLAVEPERMVTGGVLPPPTPGRLCLVVFQLRAQKERP